MFSRIIYLLMVMLIASPVSLLGQQKDDVTSAEVLTLEEAISLALHDNRQVKNAQLSIGKAGDEVAAARTQRLPSLYAYSVVSQQFMKHDPGANSSEANVVPGIGPFFSIGTTREPTAIFAGQILQPLTQLHRIRLEIRQAGLAREVEGEKLRQAQQTTINQVKQTYYRILQNQNALDSLLEAVKYYRELDRVTVDNVTQQVALKADSLEVKTRLAKAEYEALNQTNQLVTEKEQLNNLLGRDVRAEFRVAAIGDAAGFETDLALARTRALDQRPELREARLNVSQAEVDRRIKKSEYIPDVSAGFTYMSFRNFDDAVPKNSAGVGVAMRWEVFDWGRKKNQLAEKDRAIEQAKNNLRETESDVLIEVGDKFRKFQQTRQALIVAQLSQETARENMRVSVNKYKLQAALLSDALQTQATLADAGYQYQQALLAYWMAKADYEKAIGADK
jgi:outer membrane protein TolC